MNKESLVNRLAQNIKVYNSFNFEVFCDMLLKYKEEFGDLSVPQKYIDIETGYLLGYIVSSVRANKKRFDNGEKVTRYKMTAEQYLILDEMGFVWTAKLGRRKNLVLVDGVGKDENKRVRESFNVDKLIVKIQEYVDKNGTYKNITIDPAIGKIVRNVRYSYHHPENPYFKLTDKSIEKLNAIGFEWNSYDRHWFEYFFEKLVEYKEVHNGSFEGVTQDKDIGRRVNYIRRDYTKHKAKHLTPAMIDSLKSIDFPLETVGHGQWFEPFVEELIRFKQERGNFDGITGNKKIGSLVSALRRSFRGTSKFKYKITPEMIERLDEIGFELDPKNEKDFEFHLERLKRYKEEHGNFNGVSSHKGVSVSASKFRTAYKKGELSQGKIEKLEEIGFTWEFEVGAWFKPFFAKLKEYKETHGNFKGVATDSEIGYTVGVVRQAYRRKDFNRLTQEMIDKLEKIDFPWQGNQKRAKNLLELTAKRDKERKQSFKFDLFYSELLKYKEKHHDLNVPHKYISEIILDNGEIKYYSLGSVVSNVRNSKKRLDAGLQCKSHILTFEQYEMLDLIGFSWKGKPGRKTLYESAIFNMDEL